jgi:hypothetical protein
MTQFSTGILLLQEEILFAKAYSNGIHKKDYWDTTFEDNHMIQCFFIKKINFNLKNYLTPKNEFFQIV